MGKRLKIIEEVMEREAKRVCEERIRQKMEDIALKVLADFEKRKHEEREDADFVNSCLEYIRESEEHYGKR